jgi:hypothetical protein
VQNILYKFDNTQRDGFSQIKKNRYAIVCPSDPRFDDDDDDYDDDDNGDDDEDDDKVCPCIAKLCYQ